MARDTDSDYIGSLSLMGGFDMGINFDGFGENMKKFMELPIKYLDSAHDRAVELVEDINALICAPLPDDEVLNKGHGTLKDPSSNNVITGSSSTSVKMELVDPNEEFSSPTSLVTAEDSFMGSIDTDAHETESFSTKCPDNTSSEGGHIEVNDQCMLPEDTSIAEICDSCTSEDTISLGKTVSIKDEVILCNWEKPSDSCTPEDPISVGRTVSIEEEVILWNPGNYVKPPQPPESTTIFHDYVSHEVSTHKVMEQVGLHSSGHSESSACNGAIVLGKISANGEGQSELYSANDSEESTKHGNVIDWSGGTISQDLSTDMFNGADASNMWFDDIRNSVDIDLRDDQEQMKNHKAEVSSVPQPRNTSFKKIFMRSLSNKLRWSKKDVNVHQAVPVKAQEAGNVRCQAVSSSSRCQAVSSSDGLEDDWELL